MSLKDLHIDPGWTLFLDRDGVINRLIKDDYVRNPEMLEILPQVPEALAKLSPLFSKIIVVTNQRGIGRGLMSVDDLHAVNNVMQKKVESAGGRIDDVFFCPHNLKDFCNCRKPLTGMPMQAQEKYPEIAFKRSIMVGDMAKDVIMGQKLGMVTILISVGVKWDSDLAKPPDFTFPSLISFAEALVK